MISCRVLPVDTMSNNCKPKLDPPSACSGVTRAASKASAPLDASHVGELALDNDHDSYIFNTIASDSAESWNCEESTSSNSLTSSADIYITRKFVGRVSGRVEFTDDNSQSAQSGFPVWSKSCDNQQPPACPTSVAPAGLKAFNMQMGYSQFRQATLRTKLYPIERPFEQIFHNVVFVLSGFINPKRRKLKDIAILMGATYQVNWNRKCTHLICNFKNTHRYRQVMALKGRVVNEGWIVECYHHRKLLDWRKFKLGYYDYPESEDFDDNQNVEDLDFALGAGYGLSRSTLD